MEINKLCIAPNASVIECIKRLDETAKKLFCYGK